MKSKKVTVLTALALTFVLATAGIIIGLGYESQISESYYLVEEVPPPPQGGDLPFGHF